MNRLETFMYGMVVGLGIGLYLTTKAYTPPAPHPAPVPVTGTVIRVADIFDCSENAQCRILAEAIYFEARSENRIGQAAVGWVAVNRVRHGDYPDNLTDVINDGCQFAYKCDGKHERPQDRLAWNKALQLAEDILMDKVPDPTAGATHYVNRAKLKETPKWVRVYIECARIGRHTFYKEA